MKVSAVWITKNEEENIGRSIRSAKDIADEIVVVDTGSTDETVSIAESLGARIEHFEWVKDFSAARNYALQQVSGDVVIFLDADEWFTTPLSKKERRVLEKEFLPSTAHFVSCTRNNIDNISGLSIALDEMPRIMRGKGVVRYHGIIHEQAIPVKGGTPTKKRLPGFEIMHTGYGKEITPEKMARNKELLLKTLEDNPDSPDATLYTYYLFRENEGLGEIKASLGSMKELMDNPTKLREFMRKYESLACHLVMEGIRLVAANPSRINKRQIEKTLVNNFKKTHYKNPITKIVDLFYMVHFDLREDILLDEIDQAIEEGNKLREAKGDLDMAEYFRACVDIYTFASIAAWRYGYYERAFEYATNAMKATEGYTRPDTIAALVRCIRGLPVEDVILFFNAIMDMSKRGNLELLISSLQYEGFADLYIYYQKKAYDAGWAKKSDFWFLMIMMGKADDAVRQAYEDRENNEIDVFQRTVFLASLCTQEPAYSLQYKEDLGSYYPVLEAFFSDTPTENLDYSAALQNYQLIAFAAGLPVANRLLQQYKGKDDLIFFLRAYYYSNVGLYAEFLQENTYQPKPSEIGMWIWLAECYIMTQDYVKALDILEEAPKNARLTDEYFNVVVLLREKATDIIEYSANELYEKYHDIYEDWKMLRDVLLTKVHYEEDTKKLRRELVQMTVEEIRAKTEVVPGKGVFRGYLRTVEDAAVFYEKEKCYHAAVEWYSELLTYDSPIIDLDETMGRIFAEVGNEEVAEYFFDIRAARQKEMDKSFDALMGKIHEMSYEELLRYLKEKYLDLSSDMRKNIDQFTHAFPFWGPNDWEIGNFEMLERRARELCENEDEIRHLYKRIPEFRSRYVLTAIMKNLLDFRAEDMSLAVDTHHEQYFDPEIIRCGPEEVFVDVGAYIGEAVENYIETYGEENYKKIYCYEPSPIAFPELEKNTEEWPHIQLIQKGVSDKAGEWFYHINTHDASTSTLEEEGDRPVEVVTLDEDIQEPVTFIKLDVEGFEKKAIQGAANHIKNDKPKLAISLYHNGEDIWAIPKMIDEICPGYNFYLRYYGGNMLPTELILLAVYPGTEE